MPVSAADLQVIETALSRPDGDAAAVAGLRRSLPHLSLTRCDASDMTAEMPFRAFPKFSLFLVDGRDHCWTITGDPASATGLVVAANA